jgi:TRAP-type C4-dicarboxylate transport system substrate-binding protein
METVMNNLKLKTLVASLLGALLVAGTTGAIAADIKERTIKYAVIYDIKHPHGLGAQKFADLVAQRSDKKMKVNVFPNATLGGEIAIISAMQGGTVEMRWTCRSCSATRRKSTASSTAPSARRSSTRCRRRAWSACPGSSTASAT